ncbi:MAG: DUF4260 domain-containing protein [Salibacteraceae bacterium]
MKYLLRLEELALFVISIYAFYLTEFDWWWFPALLLLPDIGILGYALDAKIGAWVYNVFHHRGIAISMLAIGYLYDLRWIELLGIIFFAHIAMDRIFGYGLKHEDGFHHTHLGWIKPPHKSQIKD